MQTSSPVYEYDLTLSKLLDITQDLAGIYFEAGDESLHYEKRPALLLLIDCMNTTWPKMAVPDDVIGNVASRWRQLRLLRQLYLDDVVDKEFQHFRRQFTRKLSAEARTAIVKPGLMKSSQPKKYHHFGLDFKARFHKSICLHSMAIASRNIAKVGTLELYPRSFFSQLILDVCDIWSKNSVVAGGEKRPISLDARLDCLEVFDFLYGFLLRKVVPLDRLEDWIGKYGEHRPHRVSEAKDIEKWYYLLTDCHSALQPLDLVDLIKHQAWAADDFYPQDKIDYMRVRSVFDGGIYNHNGALFLGRSNMVNALLPDGAPKNHAAPEECCWWDLVRLDLGSPFQPDFGPEFLAQRNSYCNE
jgi:hypothetical protein